jgi:transposase
MRDATFFTRPVFDWQRRYEALRASFVDRLSAKVIADRYGYSPAYVRLLRHMFKHGKIDINEPAPEGKTMRRRVTQETREKIKSWRERRLSAGEITELLSGEGVDISVRTVERVLAEEGFPRLPRRTRLKIGVTVKGAKIPKRAQATSIEAANGIETNSSGAGVFLFMPFIAKLGLGDVVKSAGLPGTKSIPAISYLFSFLALKLLGTERYAHVGDHGFDPGLGLFAGLNVLPKCTAMSTYSYSLDNVHILRLQQAFIKKAQKLGLYDGRIINLDFHTVPHYGDESILEEHWAGARGKTMKGALTLFSQDSASKLMLYTPADIQRDEMDDQVLSFLSFWKKIQRKVKPTLIFDSRFTTYAKLSQLNATHNIKFITLRRRGKKLLEGVKNIKEWKRIHIPHPKRKYPNPRIHDSVIQLSGYEGGVRQIILRGNGRANPTFIITNDFEKSAELVVGDYARRWRVENGIAEAVKFFHLNALSSPILVKVYFDVVMTMIADTLYTMLAQKLRGFEDCDAPTLYRKFVRGKGTVSVHNGKLTVSYPRRAHNPILRGVPWHRLPMAVPIPGEGELVLQFK